MARMLIFFLLYLITVTANATDRNSPKNSRPCVCDKEKCLHFLSLSEKRSVFHKSEQELIGLLTARQGSFVLALEQPICIHGTGKKSRDFGEALDWPDETRLHVSLPYGNTKQYSELVGSRVKIIGYPFVAFSAWHRTPILFEAKNIYEIKE